MIDISRCHGIRKRGHSRYIPPSEMICQHSTEVMQTSLASAVRKCLMSRNSESINTSDVDNTGWVVWCGALLQQRSNEFCEIENSVEVKG